MRGFKEVQVMYRKPRWVSQNHIISSQMLTWTHKSLNKQLQTNANQTLCIEPHEHKCLPNTHKRNFNSSHPPTVSALITTSLGLLSFRNLMTCLSLWALLKAQMLFHLRHVTASQAWHKLSKARGKFWRFTERSGHFSYRENKISVLSVLTFTSCCGGGECM